MCCYSWQVFNVTTRTVYYNVGLLFFTPPNYSFRIYPKDQRLSDLSLPSLISSMLAISRVPLTVTVTKEEPLLVSAVAKGRHKDRHVNKAAAHLVCKHCSTILSCFKGHQQGPVEN